MSFSQKHLLTHIKHSLIVHVQTKRILMSLFLFVVSTDSECLFIDPESKLAKHASKQWRSPTNFVSIASFTFHYSRSAAANKRRESNSLTRTRFIFAARQFSSTLLTYANRCSRAGCVHLHHAETHQSCSRDAHTGSLWHTHTAAGFARQKTSHTLRVL
jgi:hypothetical protein